MVARPLTARRATSFQSKASLDILLDLQSTELAMAMGRY